MPDVSVDNAPVSVTLDGGEQVSVPSGEVWKVTISLGTDAADIDNIAADISINGSEVAVLNRGADGAFSSAPIETVATGGDTISAYPSCHIGGFVL